MVDIENCVDSLCVSLLEPFGPAGQATELAGLEAQQTADAEAWDAEQHTEVQQQWRAGFLDILGLPEDRPLVCVCVFVCVGSSTCVCVCV